jgi:ankyrin repeat protein
MFGEILRYLLRLVWEIIFVTGLYVLLKKLPLVRNYVCKEELIRGGREFGPAQFVACASGGTLPEVKLFTCAGISLNVPNADGDTALIAAARNGHEDVVRHLLSLPEIDTNAKNEVGDTALMIATRGDHNEIVGYLLDHEAIDINLQNQASDTALIAAAREGYENVIARLLKQPGIDVNVRNKADDSALLEGARRGYQQIVQWLKDAGAVEPELEKKVAGQLPADVAVRAVWREDRAGRITDIEHFAPA